MEKQIEIKLLAKHFMNAEFTNGGACPVANACKEFFNTKNVQEVVHFIEIDENSYMHDAYSWGDYWKDLKKAKATNFDDSLIRTIILTNVHKAI